MTLFVLSLLLLLMRHTSIWCQASSTLSHSVPLLDLSFLNNAQTSDLSRAISGTLQWRDSDNGTVVDPTIDIDLSASLIGKNFSGILEAIRSASHQPSRQKSFVRITATRNQFSSKEATEFFNFVIDNNSNQTTMIANSSAIGNDDNMTTVDESTMKTNGKRIANHPTFVSIESVDLGWNKLGAFNGRSNEIRKMNNALRRLISDSRHCPPIIRLNVCGIGPSSCHGIAKGLLERSPPLPLSLYLGGNKKIGDPGAAALAAAVKTVSSQQRHGDGNVRATIFKKLDLSGCNIGDTGAQALAISLENNPLCITHLDLSNNQISDDGAVKLARALLNSCVETLDLSNNKDLSDRGAKELANAFQSNGICNLILRSCNIHADGAASFAKALQVVATQGVDASQKLSLYQRQRSIDLSGNLLGVLSKKKSSKSLYSATALRSKATATTAAYMNIIGKKIRGSRSGADYPDTSESDDEEENDGMEDDNEDDLNTKCGALSFAEAFVNDDDRSVIGNTSNETIVQFELGLRQCSFDTRAAEALAAVLQESRQKYKNINLKIDLIMNNVLEDDTISALRGQSGYADRLAEMAENYHDAADILREARERRLRATRIAAARAKADTEIEMAWASPPRGLQYDRDDESSDDDDDEFEFANDFNLDEEEETEYDDW